MSQPSLLSTLRQHSAVSCDTLDPTIGAELGPFVDCTSNQASALLEVRKDSSTALIGAAFKALQHLGRGTSFGWDEPRTQQPKEGEAQRSSTAAERRPPEDNADHTEVAAAQTDLVDNLEFGNMDIGEKGVQITTVLFSLRMVPYLTGSVHVQTNSNYAHSTSKTVRDALRLVELFRRFGEISETNDASAAKLNETAASCVGGPDNKGPLLMADGSLFSVSRVVIKVPATWEGLQACRELEGRGIRTLATTVFSIEQAMLAAETGCAYVAPYVNELKVHVEAGYQDPAPNITLPARIQRLYRSRSWTTNVLPLSMVTVRQCLELTGIDYLTISPFLLKQLAYASTEPDMASQALDAAIGTELILSSDQNIANVSVYGDCLDLIDELPAASRMHHQAPLPTMPSVAAQELDPSIAVVHASATIPEVSHGLNVGNQGGVANLPSDFNPSIYSGTGAGFQALDNMDTLPSLAQNVLLPVTNGIVTALDRTKSERFSKRRYLDNETEWRMAFTRSDGGKSEAKLSQAINIFCDIQQDFEELVMRLFMKRALTAERVTVSESWKFVTRNEWTLPLMPDLSEQQTIDLSGPW